jgi:regulatory protein
MIAPKIQLSEEKIFARMATLCAKRESCKSEILKKLDRYDLEEHAKKRIITKLEKENYLNEKRYCRSFIHDKHQFNKWGRTKIEFALRQKQIPSEVIVSAFSEFPVSYFGEPLLELLRRKSKTIRTKNDFEKRTKLIRYALGKGYTMDETLRCLDSLFDKNQH